MILYKYYRKKLYFRLPFYLYTKETSTVQGRLLQNNYRSSYTQIPNHFSVRLQRAFILIICRDSFSVF